MKILPSPHFAAIKTITTRLNGKTATRQEGPAQDFGYTGEGYVVQPNTPKLDGVSYAQIKRGIPLLYSEDGIFRVFVPQGTPQDNKMTGKCYTVDGLFMESGVTRGIYFNDSVPGGLSVDSSYEVARNWKPQRLRNAATSLLGFISGFPGGFGRLISCAR